MDANYNFIDFLVSKFGMNFKKLEYYNDYSNDIFIGYKDLNKPILFVKKFRNRVNYNKELCIMKEFYSYRIIDGYPEYNIVVYKYLNIRKITPEMFKNTKFVKNFMRLIQDYHMKIKKKRISNNKLFCIKTKLSETLVDIFNKLSEKNRIKSEKKLKTLLQFSSIFDKEYSSLDLVLIHGDLSLRNFGIIGDKLEIFDFEHTRVGVLYEDFIKLYYRELKNNKCILTSILSKDMTSKLIKSVILFKEYLGILLYCESNEDKEFLKFGKYLERLSNKYFYDYLHEHFTFEIDCGMFIKAYISNDMVLKRFYDYNKFYNKYRENFINSNYINQYIHDCKSIDIPQPKINYSFEINNKIYLVQTYENGITLNEFEKLVIKKIENTTINSSKVVVKQLFLYYKILMLYLKNTYTNFRNLRIDLNTKNYIINSSDKLVLVDYIPPIYMEDCKDSTCYKTEYKYIYSNIFLQLLVMSLYIVKPLIDNNLKDEIRIKLIKRYLENFDNITIDVLGISNNKLLDLFKNNKLAKNNMFKNEYINNKIINRIKGIDLYLREKITVYNLSDIYNKNSMKIDNYD